MTFSHTPCLVSVNLAHSKWELYQSKFNYLSSCSRPTLNLLLIFNSTEKTLDVLLLARQQAIKFYVACSTVKWMPTVYECCLIGGNSPSSHWPDVWHTGAVPCLNLHGDASLSEQNACECRIPPFCLVG